MDARQLRVALVFALLLPTAAAGWASKGSYEPDTGYDARSPFMQREPDRSPASNLFKVYFNGFSGISGGITASINPNLATLRTSARSEPFLPIALFGVWKDCNDDGYVGLGDQGLLEYRAELLLDKTICPTQLPTPGREWGTHNDGQWVVEFSAIGYDDITSPEDENAMNLNDTKARVWADWGLPGDRPTSTCVTYPTPYGTFRSTGGFLRWADCYTDFRGVRTVNDAASATGQSQLSFADAPPDRPDQSGSTLNQPNPWGSESDPTSVGVFDCRDPTPVALHDPTGGSLHTLAAIPLPGGPTIYVNGTDDEGRIVNLTVYEISPYVAEGGSPAGTVNQTQAGLTDCDRTDEDELITIDGRRGGSDGDLPYALEGANEPVSAYAPRTRTDHVFRFEEGVRGTSPAASILGSRLRDDAGAGTYALTGFWVGTAPALAGQSAIVSRSSLGVQPVTYLTYYAYVGQSHVVSLPLILPGSTGYYGSEGCNGPQPTFECDPDLWWRNAAGEDVTPRDERLGIDPNAPNVPAEDDITRIGVRVWQPYQARDIDCFDASFSPARGAGLQWGLLTGSACDPPPSP